MTLNIFVFPLVLLCLVSVGGVLVFDAIRKQMRQAKLQAQLAALNPPQGTDNHRSLPTRHYYLTAEMAKPTEEEKLLLEQWYLLHPDEVRAPRVG